MKFKRQHLLLALSSFLLVASPILPFLPASEVQAVADTFTLTQSGTDKISVVLNGTPQVQLPNGVIVTTNTVYTVKDNRTFTFIGIDGAVKVQKAITMTTVPNTAPLLMVAPSQNLYLNFESGDAHSGVKDMRYVAYDEAKGQGTSVFTAWEPFVKKKAWTAPNSTVVPALTSATWVVKAEFLDVAGNISSGVIGRFFIDNIAPAVSLNKTVTYTNQRDIDVIATVVSKYKNPEEGFLSTTSAGPYQAYTLSDLTNLYTGTNVGNDLNFEYALPYTLPVTEGKYNVYFKATKEHNNLPLTSNVVTKQVTYDKTPPTGTVVINNGEPTAPSNEVKLTINTADNLSGVDKIKIVEEDADGVMKEKIIEDPPASLIVDWTLSMGETAKVSVVIYDNAGNTNVVYSQTITFAKLSITAFELTNNRNPAVYKPGNPFVVKTWDWVGANEIMLAGSSFDFNIYYDLGLGQAVDYNVTGSYKVQITSPTGTVLSTQTINYDAKSVIANGFTGKQVAIPVTAPKGSKVFVSSDLTAVRKTNAAISNSATFAPAHIGTVGDTLDATVNSLIEFNEIN